jgi:hypothetical protein
MESYKKLHVPKRTRQISIDKTIQEIQDSYCCMVSAKDCPDFGNSVDDVDACENCLFSEDNLSKFEEWYKSKS